MVSYTSKPKNHLVAHVSDTGLHLMGISYNPVLTVYRGLKGTFEVTPITLPPPILPPPNRAPGGLSSVLIGDFTSPEPFIPIRWSAH